MTTPKGLSATAPVPPLTTYASLSIHRAQDSGYFVTNCRSLTGDPGNPTLVLFAGTLPQALDYIHGHIDPDAQL